MNKIFLIAVILFFQTDKSFAQDKPRIYLSGITGNVIKKDQLLDTSIRIITNYHKEIRGIITIYFSGGGFSSPLTQTTLLNSRLTANLLIGMRERLVAGSSIIIDGYLYTDEKTKKKIYFGGSSYKVIDE